jgi:hypothetical protein
MFRSFEETSKHGHQTKEAANWKCRRGGSGQTDVINYVLIQDIILTFPLLLSPENSSYLYNLVSGTARI